MLTVDKANNGSVSGSDFLHASYSTHNTSLGFDGYKGFYSQPPFPSNGIAIESSQDDDEDEDEDDDEEEDDEDEEEDEDDEDEDEDDNESANSDEENEKYLQWRQYYQQMYKNSMYMNWMMQMQMMNQMMGQMNINPMMNQMNMNPGMSQMMGQMNMPQTGQNNIIPDQGQTNSLGPMNQMLSGDFNRSSMNLIQNPPLDQFHNFLTASSNTSRISSQNNIKHSLYSDNAGTPHSSESLIPSTPASSPDKEFSQENNHKLSSSDILLEKTGPRTSPVDQAETFEIEKEAALNKTLSKLSKSSSSTSHSLVRKSRTNTIKSNRYPSMPISLTQQIDNIEHELDDLKPKRNSFNDFTPQEHQDNEALDDFAKPNVLNRQASNSSSASYNSIESENDTKFHTRSISQQSSTAPPSLVGSTSPVSSSQPNATKKKKKPKKVKSKPSLPQMNPMSPNYINSPHQMSPNYMSTPQMMPMAMNNMNIPLINPEINPMMMNMPMNMNMNMPVNMHRSSMIPKPPGNKIDPEISEKIDSLRTLRQIISQGNKSYEFRYKWVRMLIIATNYKLYAYINIKGEPVHDQIPYNKGQFIKSATQHISKLIRDIDKVQDDDISSEICVLYANLLSHHYSMFDQDFNIAKDVETAVEYYDKALSHNSFNSRALYNLGFLYESEYDDKFDMALSCYKKLARLGYNKAIYKMALLYLNVAEIRSMNFLKILNDLAAINVERTELIDEDKYELEEIVGYANYELGKVYEGIYPGDINVNDEFLNKCLEVAPVNYLKALSYYNKSAKLDCLLAQVKLGKIYEFGELNRNLNANKSIQWYLKAVSHPLSFKRHPDAMIGLSRWCIKGTNGTSKYIPHQQPDRALKWCDRALKEYQSPESYFQMGKLAEMGLSSRPSNYWYGKAAELGYPAAIELLQG